MAEELVSTVRELLEPVLEDLGFECVDLEFKREPQGQVLRIFIDKPGGVTLDDCVSVSREVGSLLEVDDPIPGKYRLEVSSPGLDRPLKKPADFERFAGQKVKVKTRVKQDPDQRGQERKTFQGTLLGLDNGGVRIRQTDKRGGEVVLALEDISKAHLEPEF